MEREVKYAFRRKLLTLHAKGIRAMELEPNETEYEIRDGFTIYIPEESAEVVKTAAWDFADYMLTSMKVSVSVRYGEAADAFHCLGYMVDEGMEKGYRICVEQGIRICCNEERSFAQALYALEQRMNSRHAPYLEKGVSEHRILFSPRMLHSGYGLDQFPNEHLAAIAHTGRDAILVFTQGVNQTPGGFQDFNELIYRASRYGIDVYAYSYLVSNKHPADTDAESYYEKLYGSLFKECPGLKGVVLVGESVEFPSKDPRVSGLFNHNNTIDGIPTGKVTAGWWPCNDYPQWLEMVKKVITKYRTDADIVFWTYNWGWAPEEERLQLIRSLPEGISLNVTYEMFECYPLGEHTMRVDDYTLAFAGPGRYFVSEAKAAAERGIRLYSMTNTAGLTWDMGTIPYEPMPDQWMKRYQGILEAHEKWGLCGLMESHHYGFWPSFIGSFSGKALEWECRSLNGHAAEVISMEEKLDAVLDWYFGAAHREEVKSALKCYSEAIRHCIPSSSDQYGAFRVGPAYPFNLYKNLVPPQDAHALFGNDILTPYYRARINPDRSLPRVSLEAESAELRQMLAWMEKGNEILHTVIGDEENAAISELLNLGEYISCTVTTGLHAKEWYGLAADLRSEAIPEQVSVILERMEALIRKEVENAERAIPLVERDSRLGWEPTMEYLGDADRIRWKIRQLHYVSEQELSGYKEALKRCTQKKNVN